MNKQTMDWLENVVDGIDEKTTAKECLKILDQRGRACTPQQLIDKAKEIFSQTKSVKPFLVEFTSVFKFLQIDGDRVTVVYPRCFCHHIADIPAEDVPDEYCECSRSWLKELFEQATGQNVDIQLLGSVVRGGDRCRSSVRFAQLC